MEIKTKNSGELVISEDVIAKIASIASVDVKGVAGMVKKSAGFKGILRKGESAAKSVRVLSNDNGTVVEVFISLKHGAKMTTVAEEVQQSVKNAVQNMTGRVVHKVNVFVEDIDLQPIKEEQ